MDYKARILSTERILNRRAMKLTGGVRFEAEDLTLKVIEYLIQREADLSSMDYEDFKIFSLSIMKIDHQLTTMLPKIKTKALSLCSGKDSDANDLAQDIMTKLLLKREDLIKVDQLEPYVMRATRNRYIDLYRAKPDYVDPEEIDEIPSLDTAQTDRAFDDIEEALGIIGDNCKSLLIMSGQGFSYEEIGINLNIVMGTVMSRMSRCRKKFREVCLDRGLIEC